MCLGSSVFLVVACCFFALQLKVVLFAVSVAVLYCCSRAACSFFDGVIAVCCMFECLMSSSFVFAVCCLVFWLFCVVAFCCFVVVCACRCLFRCICFVLLPLVSVLL